MSERQDLRLARRADGRRRVRVVTRLVAAGAATVAVLLGVVFAQQSTGDTGSTSETGTDSGSGTDTGTDSGTWQAPGSDDGSSSTHGSTGGS